MTNFHLLALFLLTLFSPTTSGQQQPPKANPYHLEIVSNAGDYQKSVRENKANELVDLGKALPEIRLDIRYATTNNFSGR